MLSGIMLNLCCNCKHISRFTVEAIPNLLRILFD
jgi:hypothetical protein